MRELGERLAGLLRPGDLIVLSGQLGAGKTTLTQGIGAGLGVRGPVTSPTFVIARVHPSLRGGPDLVHADAYRLGSRAEMDDLDLDTDVDRSVTVVEWGEDLAEGLASSFLGIAIAPSRAAASASEQDDDEPRTVRVTGWGDRWEHAADAARGVLSGTP
jgi:tRNA threonylcarbamoyladenosine biosynthesis protein TsaE